MQFCCICSNCAVVKIQYKLFELPRFLLASELESNEINLSQAAKVGLQETQCIKKLNLLLDIS